ncbi:MAG: hypothetical protein ABIF88_01405 [archaeon]
MIKKMSLMLCVLLAFVAVAVGTLAVGLDIPHTVNGNVIYSEDSDLILDIYKVSAEVGGIPLGQYWDIDDTNFYEAIVDASGSSGKEIKFIVGNVYATPTVIFSPMGYDEIDLIINSIPTITVCGDGVKQPGEQCDDEDFGFATCGNVMILETGIVGYTGNLGCSDSCIFDTSECIAPYCGDGTCNVGMEDCSNCAVDCGSCATNNGGGGSSSHSSSGGSSSSGVVGLVVEDIEDEEETVDDEINIVEKGETEKISTSGITGGVIGILGKRVTIIAGSFIILIVLALIYVNLRKKEDEEFA